MTDFMQYVASGGTSERPSEAELDALLKRFEWFATARRVRALVRGERDERLEAVAPWRGESVLEREPVDAEALTFLTSEDIIDRFLREEHLRIVAEEGEPERGAHRGRPDRRGGPRKRGAGRDLPRTGASRESD